MRYIVAESFDRKELHAMFDVDITPRIGNIIRLRSGKSYKILDIEYCTAPVRGNFVRGVLKRVS